MRRRPPAPIRRHVRPASLAAVLLAASVVASTPASAGLGDFVKKAKQKVTQAVSPEPAAVTQPNAVPEFDDVTVELTAARLDRILAPYRAAEVAGSGRPELVQKLRVLSDERARIWDKDGDKIRETQRKRGDIEICYHDGYSAAREKRVQEYASKAATDPAILAKYARVAQQNNTQGGSDSTQLARVNDAAMEFLNPSREDSAAVRKSCGPVPSKGASELALQQLDQQMAPLEGRLRAMDEAIEQELSKNNGMTSTQWGVARDRILEFLSQKNRDGSLSKKSSSSDGSVSKGAGSGSGAKSSSDASASYKGFSRVEVEALEARLEELTKYLWY